MTYFFLKFLKPNPVPLARGFHILSNVELNIEVFCKLSHDGHFYLLLVDDVHNTDYRENDNYYIHKLEYHPESPDHHTEEPQRNLNGNEYEPLLDVEFYKWVIFCG